jgi:Protein of unknown function (DUF1552)
MSITRRQILRGSFGAALSLPLLPSLLEKEAFAKPPQRAPRLLWMTTDHGGAFESAMFPNSPLTMNASANHSVSAGALVATAQGSNRGVSPVLSASAADLTDKMLGKMNVLRGLDIPLYLAHNGGARFGNYADNAGGEGLAIQSNPRPTIDQLLGWSSSFYPNLASVKQRVMLLGENQHAWNWSNPAAKSGPIELQKGIVSSRQLFASIFVPPTKPTRAPIADQILKNYQSLRNGNARLSSEDRQRLDDHIANVDELERKLGATANCGAISTPTDDAQNHRTLQLSDGLAWASLFVEVAVAAFVCGTSRIGVMSGYDERDNALGQYAGKWHDDVAHKWNTPPGQQLLVRQYQNFFSGIFLKAAQRLDSYPNGAGGTLLDDTLLVWTQECGVATHDTYSIPVVTFGSAAGALKTGLSCDYRRMNSPGSVMDPHNGEPTALGLTYNQWLATVLQAMGLAPSEFELWGHKGYGVPIVGGGAFASHYGNTSSTYFQNASNPLPFIWA